jgi:hypothetical protein
MNQENLERLITSYADGELRETSEINSIENLLQSDKNLKFDYSVQLFTKSIVSEKLKLQPAPEQIRNKVFKEFNPLKKTVPEFLSTKAFIAYGSTAIALLAIILLIFNRTPQKTIEELSVEQSGDNNLYTRVVENFKYLKEGHSSPQLISASSAEIKAFFRNEGLKYDLFVPTYDNWELLGADIFQLRGEKFAVHYYNVNGSSLIYFFQADISFFENDKIIKLSEDLIEYLNEGNCFITYEENLGIVMKQSQHNIIAVVSDISPVELEKNFCNLNLNY